MRIWLILAALVIGEQAIACGGGDSTSTATPVGTSSVATSATKPALTRVATAAAVTPTTPTADVPVISTTPAAAGANSPAINIGISDPTLDCLANTNGAAIDCTPSALDIRGLTVATDPDGQIVVEVVLSNPGLLGLSNYALTVAFDVDRDATTGDQSFRASHGIGADLILTYVVKDLVATNSAIAIERGVAGPLEPSLVSWTFVDSPHVEATVGFTSLTAANGFYAVASVAIGDRHDDVPNNAKLSFPEGAEIPR